MPSKFAPRFMFSNAHNDIYNFSDSSPNKLHTKLLADLGNAVGVHLKNNTEQTRLSLDEVMNDLRALRETGTIPSVHK